MNREAFLNHLARIHGEHVPIVHTCVYAAQRNESQPAKQLMLMTEPRYMMCYLTFSIPAARRTPMLSLP